MKKGFTLAEVLITLGIIGVVAALTMPSLIANHQKKTLAVQLKRSVNIVQNAARLYMAQEELPYVYDTSGFTGLFDGSAREAYMKETLNSMAKSTLKIAKDCTSDPSGCFADSYRNIDGQPLNDERSQWKNCYAHVSGESICLFPVNMNLAAVVMDINGKKKPNTFGRDLFTATLDRYGAISGSVIQEFSCLIDDTACLEIGNAPDDKKCKRVTSLFATNGGGSGVCFSLVQQNSWEMNY